MAFNQTTNLMKSKWDNYTPEATGLWNNFKKYFQVSNQYVVAKLRVFWFVVDSNAAYIIPLPVSILETSCNRGRGWSEVLPPASSRCLRLWLVHSLDGDLHIHRNCRLYSRNQRNLLSSNHLYLSLRMLRCHHSRSSFPRLDLMQLLLLKLILFLISCPAPILDLLSLISYKFVG